MIGRRNVAGLVWMMKRPATGAPPIMSTPATDPAFQGNLCTIPVLPN
jgi:hypothetical protein